MDRTCDFEVKQELTFRMMVKSATALPDYWRQKNLQGECVIKSKLMCLRPVASKIMQLR